MRTITDHLAAVDGVSPAVASAVADAFPTWKALTAASTDDLRAVRGVGPVLATRIQGAAVEASPRTATRARTDEASAAARTAITAAGAGARSASSAVASRADRSATATKAAARRARERGDDAMRDATTSLADAADTAGDATRAASDDFAAAVDRRRFGPFTLPADLPWPVNMALDTTETVVGLGLRVTTGVLSTVGRKLR